MNPVGLSRTIMIDFEKAAEQAFRSCINNVQINGCLFHLCQSHKRQIESHGMKQRYANDKIMSWPLKNLQHSLSVTLLMFNSWPEQLANQFLQQFGNTPQHEHYLEYLENTWI